MSQIFEVVSFIFEENLRSMKPADVLELFTGFFDYFRKLKPSERIHFSYMSLLIGSWFLMYLNDKRHCENTVLLSNRVELGDSLRSQDQKEYKKGLENYTDKFVRFSEIILQQKEKIEQIKKEQ